MSQPEFINTNFVIRCMGGEQCNHAPGTCTATKGDTPILPDWVLLEGAKRCGWADTLTIAYLQRCYGNTRPFRAVCDMIAKHEQKPVDRKLLCAREAVSEDYFGDQRDDATDACVRAIELYLEGYGE